MPYQIVCDGELQDLGRHPVPPQPAGPRGLRPGPPAGRAGRRQPEDRGPAEDPRVRGQHHPALPPGHRRGLGGPPGRLRAARRPGDGAVVLARVQPRLPRRQRPQGPRPGRPRQEARDLPRPGDRRSSARGSGSTSPPRSSRATAWSSTATTRPGVPEQGGRVYEVVRPGRGGRPAPRPEGSPPGPAELRFGRRRPRPPPAPPRPAGLEDRRPRADPPPPQDVRGPARTARSTSTSTSAPSPASRCGSRAGPRPGFARGVDVRRPAGRRRRTWRRPRTCSATSSAGSAARSTSCGDLTADDRGRADGPQEPAQRPPPRPGRPARRGRRDRPAPDDRRRAGPARPAAPPIAGRAGSEPPTAPRPCRSSAGPPPRSRRRSPSGIRTIYARLPGHQALRRRRRRRPARRRPRSSSPRPGSRSLARPTSSATWPSRGPTACSSATPAACYYCAERGIPFVADFSLNAANELTVELLKGRGALAGHGLVRPELRPARRPARGRPARSGWRS